jgi:hypothetical protein
MENRRQSRDLIALEGEEVQNRLPHDWPDEPADDILVDFILPEKWVPPQEAMRVSQKKCDSGFMVVGGMF